ncbi:hypothetical protein [Dyella tabacisoli]|uniref:hypothetical protein n=1 Tax=Dyella tabacisoli TaxID=2282381 RepID=UPI001782019B|nr:hypothetical protein [Dyella tabacisoli]
MRHQARFANIPALWQRHLTPPSQGQHTTMIETNPILAQIADLKGRVESLRGYL